MKNGTKSRRWLIEPRRWVRDYEAHTAASLPALEVLSSPAARPA